MCTRNAGGKHPSSPPHATSSPIIILLSPDAPPAQLVAWPQAAGTLDWSPDHAARQRQAASLEAAAAPAAELPQAALPGKHACLRPGSMCAGTMGPPWAAWVDARHARAWHAAAGAGDACMQVRNPVQGVRGIRAWVLAICVIITPSIKHVFKCGGPVQRTVMRAHLQFFHELKRCFIYASRTPVAFASVRERVCGPPPRAEPQGSGWCW